MLSVIIPAYNEEGNISKAADIVRRLLIDNSIEYEIIFINDGSSDNTWLEISRNAEMNPAVFGITFSRNFGKESAIFAGLRYAKGNACVIMDCDLQHPPEKIIEMYKIWKNNDIDIIEGIKTSRGNEGIFHKISAKLFYGIIRIGSGLDLRNASDFKLLDRHVIDALNTMPERLTFFRAMSSWVGFKKESVYYDVEERQLGKTKWSLKSLIKYAIRSITSYTSIPMQIVTFIGAVSFILSLILGINTLYNKLSGKSLEGFSTVILLQLFTSSIIMFSLGIIGYYISKIYEEIKNRPRYIVSDIIDNRNNAKKEKDDEK